MRIGLAYILSTAAGTDTDGLWLAVSLSNVVAGLASLTWVAAGRWCRPVA